MRLSNAEKWRRENDCLSVRREEVLNEINMKVRPYIIIKILVLIHLWE